MPTLTIPSDLQHAIKQALSAMPEARWMQAAHALSERYRAPRPATALPLASSAADVLGYLALILPASYGQLHGAITATAARIPNWQPRTMLDLGSGPGTALWAATNYWPSLAQLTAWEREPTFLTVGKQLAAHSTVPALQHARWEQHDLRSATIRSTYDLVVLGHVLNELDQPTQVATVQAAWAATSGVLLIVEPGTIAAFAVVRAARDQLASAAHTIAPCAHNRPCPLENDWCHFPQRLVRPAVQRKARGAPSTWEDSKFSYAALARFPAEAPIWGRVIREPRWNKAYAEARISSADGVADRRAMKRTKHAFKIVKNLEWGQALDQPLDAPE